MENVKVLGSRNLIYDGELYSFPNKKIRDEVIKEIERLENSRSLYAEMDLKARIYKYLRGRI